MAKRRNRRLRKKLRIGEFQELGFSVDVRVKRELTPGETDVFLDALLLEAIEARRLTYCGGTQGGFVAREGRGSATDEDRQAVLAWLRAREEVEEATATQLVDAWYDTGAEDG